jgi:hypothetical protein
MNAIASHAIWSTVFGVDPVERPTPELSSVMTPPIRRKRADEGRVPSVEVSAEAL